MAGGVAGVGGSSYTVSGVGSVYVSGEVVLDGPQLSGDATATGNDGETTAVIEHELGHLVGLDHVNDPTQLMNPTSDGQVLDFAAGDLQGLDQLGRGRCHPEGLTRSVGARGPLPTEREDDRQRPEKVRY